MQFSELEESGLTIEQELLLHRIFDRLKHLDRQQLLEAALWAWETVMRTRNDFMAVGIEIGVTLQLQPLKVQLFPEENPVPLPLDEIQALRSTEGLLEDSEDEDSEDEDEPPSALGVC